MQIRQRLHGEKIRKQYRPKAIWVTRSLNQNGYGYVTYVHLLWYSDVYFATIYRCIALGVGGQICVDVGVVRCHFCSVVRCPTRCVTLHSLALAQPEPGSGSKQGSSGFGVTGAAASVGAAGNAARSTAASVGAIGKTGGAAAASAAAK